MHVACKRAVSNVLSILILRLKALGSCCSVIAWGCWAQLLFHQVSWLQESLVAYLAPAHAWRRMLKSLQGRAMPDLLIVPVEAALLKASSCDFLRVCTYKRAAS